MIFSGRPHRAALSDRSVFIGSYGIKYTWHVHESDNCHSCSTDVSINRVRSFALMLVRSLTHSLVFTPSHSLFFLFLISVLSLSPPCALFIAIIPRYALALLTYGALVTRSHSCFSFCTSRRRRSTKRG